MYHEGTDKYGKLHVGSIVPCNYCAQGVKWAASPGSHPIATVCGVCNGWGYVKIKSFTGPRLSATATILFEDVTAQDMENLKRLDNRGEIALP